MLSSCAMVLALAATAAQPVPLETQTLPEGEVTQQAPSNEGATDFPPQLVPDGMPLESELEEVEQYVEGPPIEYVGPPMSDWRAWPKKHEVIGPFHYQALKWFSSYDMPQHLSYYPPAKGYYYFRPYHFLHYQQQASFVTRFGGDPRLPYANEIFDRVYEQYEMERLGGETVSPSIDLPPPPEEDAGTLPTPEPPADQSDPFEDAPPALPQSPPESGSAANQPGAVLPPLDPSRVSRSSRRSAALDAVRLPRRGRAK